MNKTVLFTANRGYALTSSRTALIRHFLSLGWKLILATADDPESRELCRIGGILEPVHFPRSGISPLADMAAFHRLFSIYRKWRPCLIHHFHAKPVILGSLAARHIPGNSVRVVNIITGLGHAFVTGGCVSWLASLGYRVSLGREDITIFQNRDDQSLFLGKGWVTRERARLIPGSGVDTDHFMNVDRHGRDNRGPVVIMLGRLLRQKGIPEFVEVSNRIRRYWPDARFLWAGEEDLVHPDAVSGQWLQAQDGVEYLGRLSDVVPVLSEADLLLFPSYYREGVPRVVLEAAAMGLPVVGFDVPGVREAVRNGKTGFLVAKGDLDSLTKHVKKLLEDEVLRLRMGKEARAMVVKSFDLREIQKKYLEIYRELGFDL